LKRDPLEVRPLEAHEELTACVGLQKRIWGEDYGDVVPASVLKISQQVGGVAMGAFLDGEGPLGFVYGLTGVREGHLTHWSHMLGVLKEHRGKGIGQRLKQAQREWLVARGVMEMRWTFDPLVSGNAHFNLNCLGVRIHRYVPEMYGDTGSALHSFGTDRFIVHWDLAPSGDGAEARESGSSPGTDPWDNAPVLARNASTNGAGDLSGEARPPALRIEIPRSIMAVHRDDPARALAWREATRKAFLESWRAGYRVDGFARSDDGDRCHYLLRARVPAGTEIR
jgi:chorismate synthase